MLTVYPEEEVAHLPDHLLYHLLLASQAVILLKPEAWEIPLHGSLYTPDARLLFPWGTAYVEVDTGFYSPQVVRDKMRRFAKEAAQVYWASPSPTRLDWALSLGRKLQTPLTPLLLTLPV